MAILNCIDKRDSGGYEKWKYTNKKYFYFAIPSSTVRRHANNLVYAHAVPHHLGRNLALSLYSYEAIELDNEPIPRHQFCLKPGK